MLVYWKAVMKQLGTDQPGVWHMELLIGGMERI